MERFSEGLPALAALKANVARHASQGFIPAIDGRKIPIRSPHAALNSLLQSTGSVLCKDWLLQIDGSLKEQGLAWGRDYYFLGWIHDEVQIAVKEGYETRVGQTAVSMAPEVGKRFSFRCPLAAEYRQGSNWAETH